MPKLEAVIELFPSLEIVITSSWREEKSLDELIKLLGTNIGQRVVGTTPIIDDAFLHFVRYHEVSEYLKTVTERDKTWVALDDESGNYPKDAPVVLVDRRTGFTSVDQEILIALIKDKID